MVIVNHRFFYFVKIMDCSADINISDKYGWLTPLGNLTAQIYWFALLQVTISFFLMKKEDFPK